MNSQKRLARYINNICRSIKDPISRESFRAELMDHFEQKITQLMKDNQMNEEEAIKEALRQTGSWQTIAMHMRKLYPPRLISIVQYVCLALTCIFAVWWLLRLLISGPTLLEISGDIDGPTSVLISVPYYSSLILLRLSFAFAGLSIFFFFVFPKLKKRKQKQLRKY